MWQCFGKSYDCFTLQCAAVCVLQSPLVVSCPARLSRPTWAAGPVDLQDIETAATKSAEEIATLLQVDVESLQAFAADPFCMQLNGVFTHLIGKNAWSSIMCRVASLPTPRQPREFEAHSAFFGRLRFPTPAFLQQFAQPGIVNVRMMQQSQPSVLPFHGDAAAQLVRDLQRWAPCILAECASHDETIAEQMVLEEHVQRLSSFVEACRGAHSKPSLLSKKLSTHYDINRLIKCLCAAMSLKDRSELAPALQTALEGLPEFAGFREQHFRIPHKSTLSRSQVIVDMMYCCYWRDILTSFKGVSYAWVDASPQGGVDWLIAMIRFIPARDVKACFEAASTLERTVPLLQQAFEADDSDALIALARERWQCRQVLDRSIFVHRLLPGGIGSGAAKLDQKLGSFCAKLFAETQTLAGLQEVLACIRGFCTDSGTEMALADASGVTLEQILPSWMLDTLTLQADAEPDDLDCNREAMGARSDSPYVFPNALVCPGALHVVHSMVQDVDASLTFFEEWLPSFRALVYLLHRDHLRQRLVATCVLGTRFEGMKDRVRKLAEPALWRWNALASILTGALRVKPVLQAVWSKERFLQVDGANNELPEGLDVNVLSDAIRSEKFWGYTCMLSALHGLAEGISSWFEGCSCHSPLFQEQRGHAPQAPLFRETFHVACRVAGVPPEQHENCPLAGQRSAELASGAFTREVQELADAGLEFFLQQTNGQTDPELLETLVAGYSRGRAHFTEHLAQKFQCWDTLPWKFAALAQADDCQAQLAACQILQLLLDMPRDPELHHRLTWQFLRTEADGSETALLVQLRQLSQARSSLCQDPALALLRQFVQELKFLPTVERIVEAQHGNIKKALGFRHVSGSYVSTTLRMPEMKQLFKSPANYERLLQAWPQVIKPDDAAKRFGLFQHPRYQEACAEKHSQQQKRQTLAVLLYMLDAESQFRSIASLRKRREEHKRKKVAAKEKFFKNLNAGLNDWSVGNVERRAAAQHMQDQMEPGQLYSLPVDSTALPSLQSKLQTPAVGAINLPAQPLEGALADDLDLNPGAIFRDPAQQVTLQLCQVEGALVPPPEAEGNVPIMFVRLSRTAPARSKVVSLPAASGMRLSSTDMTVTIHTCVRSHEACWVQVEPQKAEGVLSPVSVLSLSNTDAQTLPFVLRQWSTCKKLVYCFRDRPATPALASLLERVVSQRAFPGTRISQHVRIKPVAEQAETALCEGLAHAGFFVKSSQNDQERTWALTQQGLQSLVHMHEVCRPKLVFPSVEALLDRVRDGLQEVQGFTSWELLAVLKHKGWQLQPLPSTKKKRRALPAHTRDSTSLICYCGSKNSLTLESPMTKTYMQSLVLSDELFHSMVSCIHHGQAEKYYRQLLDPESAFTGELPEEVPAQALQDRGAQLQIDDDLSLDHSGMRRSQPPEVPEAVPLSLPVSTVPHRSHEVQELMSVGSESFEELVLSDDDPAAAVTESEHEQCQPSSPCASSVMEDIVREMGCDNFAEAACPDVVQGVEGSEPPPPAPCFDPFADDDEEDIFQNEREAIWAILGGPAEGSAAGDQPAAASEEIQGLEEVSDPPEPEPSQHRSEAALRTPQVHPDSFTWGSFRLTFSGPATRPPHGAWQAKCKYHKLNAKTWCTRAINISDSAGSKQKTLRVIKAWCLAACNHTRKDAHALEPLTSSNILPDEVLDARLRMMPPPPAPADLLPDDQQPLPEPSPLSPADAPGSMRRGHKRKKGAEGVASKAKAQAKAKGRATSKAKAKGKAKSKQKTKTASAAKAASRARAGPSCASDEAASDPHHQMKQLRMIVCPAILLPALQAAAAAVPLDLT